MPTGKVKWYDVEKGFGFLSKDEGGDVYVRSAALPEGVADPQGRHPRGVRRGPGPQGRPGPPGPAARRRRASVSKAMRKKPAEMVNIVEDLYRLLEGIEKGYRGGRHPDPEDRQADRHAAARARRRAGDSEAAHATPVRRVCLAQTVMTTQTVMAEQHRGGDAEADPRDQRQGDAEEAADDPRQLQQRLGAGEGAGRVRSGTSRWISASSDSLPSAWQTPGGEAEEHHGQQPVEQRRDTHRHGVGDEHDHDDRARPDPAQHVAQRDADGVAEAGRADDQGEQQLGPVLPAGERLVAQQERHEQGQEAATAAAARRCSAARAPPMRRHPGRARPTRERARSSPRRRRPSPAAGSPGSCRPRTPANA